MAGKRVQEGTGAWAWILGVLGAVVAGWIVEWLTPVAVFAAVWNWLAAMASNSWSWAWSPATVPRLIWYTLLMFVALAVVRSIRSSLRKTAIPSFHTYKQDRFEGAIWRWNFTANGRIVDVIPHCPTCDMVLTYVSDHWSFHDEFDLACEHCGVRKGRTHHCKPHHLEDLITRKVERKIRTGEWKEAVAAKP